MAVELVLAEVLAVVGRDDHQRVRQQAAPVQLVEEPAELLVEVGDAVVVGVAARAGSSLGASFVLSESEPPVQDRDVGGRLGLDAEVPVEAAGRDVGVVGVEEVQEREEGPIPLAPRSRRAGRR